ncbi:unnamed protein product [Blepharisma stoltei]|uniref:non-specific serine/threonine protein kinase n=1 Tax=Blepharisma stoltei TaxID=1481888 RepID=A0AAU9J6D5_9CILI|nr:unnamed protein product [Blepharisma stoltei]
MGVCICKESQLKNPRKARILSTSEISNDVRLESIRDKYEFLKVLGYGQFGTVREAKKIRDIHMEKTYAIKSICKDKVKKNLVTMKRELDILKLVDHPNIIKLYEIYEDARYIHLVMELCTGGDIFDYILNKQVLTEDEVGKIMKCMLSAVNHLHSLKIVHRDLKPENFLFASKAHDADIKLVDFGMSNKFGEDHTLHTMVGTPYYVAPEVLKGNYGKECDVWSLGVLMYFMLSGTHPFRANDVKGLFKKIVKCEYNFDDERWTVISKHAKSLIQKLLVVNPHHRISIKNALIHPWFHYLGQKHQAQHIKLEIFNSIKSLKAPSKLWQEAMKVFVRDLSEEQIAELQAAFQEIDQSRTGFITAEDISDAMRRNGYSLASEEISSLIEQIDYIGNGKLNYTQFLIAAMDRKRLLDEESMWSTFKHFDVDNNGTIQVEELKFALEKAGCFISELDMVEILNEFQLKAGNGMNFGDFKEIMTCFSEDASALPEEANDGRGKERKVTRRLSQKRLTVRRATQMAKKEEIANQN